MPRLYYGVYRGVLWLIFPVLLVFILIHSVMKKASLKRYLYKLSILRPKLRPGLRRIWIHGVSAGEIASIEKFSEIIGKEFELFISTTTFSGTEMAEKLFSYYDRGLYPFDYPLFCGRMLDRVKPVALVFVEGEIWPNMLRKAGEQGIPCFLISGKLLEKDFRRYNILRGFFKSVLNRYEMVLAQSHRDYERFLQLGISQEKIRLGGSIKMDQPMDESSSGRQDYHGNRRESLLLTAASTHQGEESFVIKLYERLLVKIPYLKLMIAPRKPERSAEIRNIIMSSGYEPGLRSDFESIESLCESWKNEIMVLDSMGELRNIYLYSDIVLMGGSFIKSVGCHNPVEALIQGLPLVVGPFTESVSWFLDELADAAVVCQVSGRDDEQVAVLESFIEKAIRDRHNSDIIAGKVKALVDRHKGASGRACEEIVARIAKNDRD